MTQHLSEPFLPADDLESEPTEPISLVPPATLGQRLEAFERRVERRFDLLHQELHLLRVQVTGDHAPRLTQVEQKAGGAVLGKTVLVGKYGAGIAMGAVAARAIARGVASQWPQAQPVVDVLETILSPLGL
jgi:hypothetical protein